MALYSNSAFTAPYKQVLRSGTQITPIYLFGASEYKTEPWVFQVTQVSLTSNVAAVTGTIVSGGGASPNNVPLVGAKCGVRGTTTNSGIFNVDPATVTVVAWNASTGVATISFALTHANVGATADVGEMIVQPGETFDLVSAGSASQPVALAFTPDESDNSRCLFAEAKWTGTSPTAATVILQASNVDDDSRYATLKNAYGMVAGASVAQSDALATIATSAVTQSGAQYNFVMGKFLRAKVLSMTGGDGTTGLLVSLFM